jgi:hypothetical protein
MVGTRARGLGRAAASIAPGALARLHASQRRKRRQHAHPQRQHPQDPSAQRTAGHSKAYDTLNKIPLARNAGKGDARAHCRAPLLTSSRGGAARPDPPARRSTPACSQAQERLAPPRGRSAACQWYDSQRRCRPSLRDSCFRLAQTPPEYGTRSWGCCSPPSRQKGRRRSALSPFGLLISWLLHQVSPPGATSCGPFVQFVPSVVYWKRRYFEAVLLQRTSKRTVMLKYPVVGVLNTMPAVRLPVPCAG